MSDYNQGPPGLAGESGSAAILPIAKRRRGCFFYGCATILIALVFAVGLVSALFYYAQQSLTPVCDAYLAAVAAGDYRSAYDMVGPEWKKSQTFEEFERFEKTIGDKVGPVKSKTLTGTKVNSEDGVTQANVEYKAEFAKANGSMSATLVKYGGKWTLEGFRYNSKVLQANKVCPSCGSQQKSESAFCSSCGKPMTEDAQTTGTGQAIGPREATETDDTSGPERAAGISL